MANEKYMPWTVVIDVFYCCFGRRLEKIIFPFLFTPAKLIGDDQTISNGAANTSCLLITHKCIGATKQIAPMYWCC